MLHFAAPQLADADSVRCITQRAGSVASDLAFANIYLLQNKYNTQICIQDGILYRCFRNNSRLQGYAFPCGCENDTAADHALRCIEADARARQQELRFCLLTDENAACLNRLRPSQYTYHCDRGNADYLYRQSDLASLPGSAYHAKRNHLARFERLYPDWNFQPLSSDLIPDARCVADEWYRHSNETSIALQHEQRALHHALDHIAELRLTGGIIYVEHQPIAVAIAGSISAHAASVHYEKCHPNFRDAYPVINRCVAELLAPAPFINREEDMNLPGLRKAKLSYHPTRLLQKWDALPCVHPSTSPSFS